MIIETEDTLIVWVGYHENNTAVSMTVKHYSTRRPNYIYFKNEERHVQKQPIKKKRKEIQPVLKMLFKGLINFV